jgi:hypothetical protein
MSPFQGQLSIRAQARTTPEAAAKPAETFSSFGAGSQCFHCFHKELPADPVDLMGLQFWTGTQPFPVPVPEKNSMEFPLSASIVFFLLPWQVDLLMDVDIRLHTAFCLLTEFSARFG